MRSTWALSGLGYVSFHIGALSQYFHHTSPSSPPIHTDLVLLERYCQGKSNESKLGRFGAAVVEMAGFYPLCGCSHIFFSLFTLFLCTACIYTVSQHCSFHCNRMVV